MPIFSRLALFCVIAASTFLFSCTNGDEENDNLEPELLQETLRIDPNPAWLYEDATFLLAWKDHDGDMENPTVILRREDETEASEYVEVGEVLTDGSTSGILWFDLEVLDGYQGNYFVSVLDEAGHASNEIEVYLFVNPNPRVEE